MESLVREVRLRRRVRAWCLVEVNTCGCWMVFLEMGTVFGKLPALSFELEVVRNELPVQRWRPVVNMVTLVDPRFAPLVGDANGSGTHIHTHGHTSTHTRTARTRTPTRTRTDCSLSPSVDPADPVEFYFRLFLRLEQI